MALPQLAYHAIDKARKYRKALSLVNKGVAGSCIKLLVPIAHGATLEKRAELSKTRKSISEMSRQRPKSYLHGHTITLLTFTLLSLIKNNVIFEQ